MLKIEFNKKLGKVIFVSIISIAAIFVFGASIKTPGTKSLIWIEAEKASQVIQPLHIVDMDGASEGKGLIAIGNHFRKEGYAKYKFTTEQDGEFIIWGRCYWSNVCTNSFNLTIDDENKLEVIGEDPVTSQWHWVMGPRFKLKKGDHNLILWNREENSQVDKFLITSDDSYVPEGFGISSSVSENFESGSIPANFIVTGGLNWKVVVESGLNRSLLGSSPSKASRSDKVIIAHNYGNNYTYNIALKGTGNERDVADIFFNYGNESNYDKLRLEGKTFTLFQVKDGKQHILDSRDFKTKLISDQFRDVSIHREGGKYTVKFTGASVFNISDMPTVLGNAAVGFGAPSGGIYFDNVCINLENNVNYNESFHGTDFQAFRTRPEVAANYLQNLKKARRNWWIINGDWVANINDGFEGIEGKAGHSAPASVVFGTDYWKNYELQAATRLNGDGGIGVIFNFQDKDNYNLFSWQKKGFQWRFLLDKIESGRKANLVDTVAPSPVTNSFQWYKINFKILEDTVQVLLNNTLVVQKKSNLLKGEGKTGVWTNCGDGAYFDDITANSISNLKPAASSAVRVYNLNKIQLDIPTSFSDWEPSGKKTIQLVDSANHPWICIKKELFEPATISNIRYFNENFRITTENLEIPADIDVDYRFTVNQNKNNDVYHLVISTARIRLLKNDKSVFDKDAKLPTRAHIEIEHFKETWKISVDQHVVFKFADSARWQRTKIGFGYSGIGDGKIVVDKITIENQ